MTEELTPLSSPVRALLIGAGNRGSDVFGRYALDRPERLRIVGVAEPVGERRARFAARHDLAPECVFEDWGAAFAGGPAADAAIIATDDMTHVEPTLAALESGHHVLLEKPMAPTLDDCVRVVRAAEQADRVLQIGHVLRYTHFYRTVDEILRSGRLGELLSVDMKEHVAYWHFTHSYVRGKFRNRGIAAPIILAKCCHDLDLLTWLVRAPVERLSSFGNLAHFRGERAPPGAPKRCTDGCPAQSTCLHDAVRFYAEPEPERARRWPWSDVSVDPSRAARHRALEEGRYGVCVYQADNDVPDHQVVNLEFANGVLATFTMQGHATRETRSIRMTGTLGELRGLLSPARLELTWHGTGAVEEIPLEQAGRGHFGGDTGLLDHFTRAVSGGEPAGVHTSGRVSLESHVLGFAAEQARLEARVIELAAFRDASGVPLFPGIE